MVGNQSDAHKPSETDPVVGEIATRLAAAYRPERIYLFGSAARGDAGGSSDYDFMIVVPDDAPLELRTSAEAYRVLHDIPAPVDVAVYRRTSFDSRLHLKASFPATIVREGRLLYAA